MSLLSCTVAGCGLLVVCSLWLDVVVDGCLLLVVVRWLLIVSCVVCV